MSRLRRPSPPTAAGLVLALALLGCGVTAPLAARVASDERAAVAAVATTAPVANDDTSSPVPTDQVSGPDVAPTMSMVSTTSPPPPPPSAEAVMRAQRLLVARGTDIGEVDGLVGDRTKAGVADFQRAAGLPQTGALDPLTLERLEVDSAALAADLPASVVVDLSDQRATVFNVAGAAVAAWPVSTGGPGSETPTGTFTVQSRQRTGQAEDAPTVHMDFFTVFNGDIGFHGIPWAGDRANPLWTPLGEYAVSHGCIRMADDHARLLYTFLPDGAPVVVQP